MAKRRSMYGLVDGMRFLPTDMELIAYLRKRAEGSPLPPTLMHECDVYAQEPWNLPRDFMHGIGEEVYYFTPRHKASGCRANRNAGQGFWHGNGRDQLIFDDESSELIGHKTSLVFRLSDSKRKRLHPNWIMHEYLLHSPDGKFQEMALCRIHPKEDNKNAENDYPTAHGCKRRRIHVARSTLFDKFSEVRDGSNGEDIAEVIEQEVASQLVWPSRSVDDRSTGTAISSISSVGSYIDSDTSKWAEPMSVLSSNQAIEMLISSESRTLSEADVLELIDILLAIDHGMVAQISSFATGGTSGEDVAKVTTICIEQDIASHELLLPPGSVDDLSIDTTNSFTSGDGCSIDSGTLKWAGSMILTPPSSPISVPSSSQQPIEVIVSSESGTLSEFDDLAWIDRMLAADDGMVAQPSSSATESSINHPISADILEWVATLKANENAFALGLI